MQRIIKLAVTSCLIKISSLSHNYYDFIIHQLNFCFAK